MLLWLVAGTVSLVRSPARVAVAMQLAAFVLRRPQFACELIGQHTSMGVGLGNHQHWLALVIVLHAEIRSPAS